MRLQFLAETTRSKPGRTRKAGVAPVSIFKKFIHDSVRLGIQKIAGKEMGTVKLETGATPVLRHRSALAFSGGIALALALAGCTSPGGNPYAAPPPPSPGGGAPLLSDQEIAAARKLYVAKCAKCHKFHNPAKYTDEEWHTWMRKMSRKSKLKPEQNELLSRYLGTFRAAAAEQVME